MARPITHTHISSSLFSLILHAFINSLTQVKVFCFVSLYSSDLMVWLMKGSVSQKTILKEINECIGRCGIK